MSEKQKIVLLTLIGVAGYVFWALIAFYVDKSQIESFVNFTKGIVIGVVGLVLRDMKPAGNKPDPDAPGKEEQGDAPT